VIDLSAHLRSCFPDEHAFDRIMQLEGTVFRRHKNRRTFQVDLDGRSYFVKVHGPTGWREILKNLAHLRLPVISAAPERRAIERLQSLDIPTVRAVGYGHRGVNPARRESFIVTDALQEMARLDELASDWGGLAGPARWRLRQALIDEVADIARTLHRDGLNHRDFYLVHFLLPDRDWRTWTPDAPLRMHLIDLHRMQIRHRTPQRWIVKDLAGLLFSALDLDLTFGDYLRFWARYRLAGWRSAVSGDASLLRQVIRRAARLYRHEQGTPPRLPAAIASFAGIAPCPSPSGARTTLPGDGRASRPGPPSTADRRDPR
jgi:heptose I phosphotransferase